MFSSFKDSPYRLLTDLINTKVWIRRNNSSSRVVNSFSRQISPKSTLLALQSLHKASGTFLWLANEKTNHCKLLMSPNNSVIYVCISAIHSLFGWAFCCKQWEVKKQHIWQRIESTPTDEPLAIICNNCNTAFFSTTPQGICIVFRDRQMPTSSIT